MQSRSKTPLRKATSVVVCGWDPGPRGGLRALILGSHNPAGDLYYVGMWVPGSAPKTGAFCVCSSRRSSNRPHHSPNRWRAMPARRCGGSAPSTSGTSSTASSPATCAIPAGKDCATYPHPQSGSPATTKEGSGPACGPNPGSPASARPLQAVGVGGRRPRAFLAC